MSNKFAEVAGNVGNSADAWPIVVGTILVIAVMIAVASRSKQSAGKIMLYASFLGPFAAGLFFLRKFAGF